MSLLDRLRKKRLDYVNVVSVMYIFELYTLRNNFFCGKEEVSLIEK